MKKTLIIISILIAFLIIYLLQSNFFNWFTIAGVSPNLFVIIALFLGLFIGRSRGLPIVLVMGIFLDFFIGKKIGTSAIMLGAVVLIAGYFEKNFSKDSRITILLMTAGVTFIYEVGSYILNIFLLGTVIEIIPFVKILLIEILYNVILTIILHPLIQKVGYSIEDTFKESKILTRYF